MTIKDILNNAGLGQKIFDRFHHSHAPPHGPYGQGYGYQAAPSYHGQGHGHSHGQHVFKHYSFSHNGGGGGGKGGGAALSALTLLSFLFFLNILQQCLKDQMMAMNPQVMVVSGREGLEKQEMKEAKPTAGQQRVGTRNEGIGRAQPTDIEDANKISFPEGTSTSSERSKEPGELVQRAPAFVYAMGDGVGEIINEQK